MQIPKSILTEIKTIIRTIKIKTEQEVKRKIDAIKNFVNSHKHN